MVLFFASEDLASSLSSAREEAGVREREWEEEKGRREAETEGLSQQVKQLQNSLTSTQREKTEVLYMWIFSLTKKIHVRLQLYICWTLAKQPV